MCETCAKLIDTDEVRFPSTLLHKWRDEAELRARQEIEGSAGMAKIDDSPAFNAWVRLLSEPPRFALVVAVWLHNCGNKSAHSIRLRLEHSDTHTVACDAYPQWWQRTSPRLNPWELECTRVVNPDESVPVIGIPFREMPSDEVWLRLRITAEDIKASDMACRFSPAGLDLQKEQRVAFSAL